MGREGARGRGGEGVGNGTREREREGHKVSKYKCRTTSFDVVLCSSALTLLRSALSHPSPSPSPSPNIRLTAGYLVKMNGQGRADAADAVAVAEGAGWKAIKRIGPVNAR